MSRDRITTDPARIADILRRGGVAAIPTETVYGLAGSIESREAIARIFEIKERPLFDPLIVHVTGAEQARALVMEWPETAERLAQTFWPGPLTLVLPKRTVLDPLITANLETVGVRAPDHPLTLKAIELVGAPVAAPSANRFGRTSPTTAEHVLSEFPEHDFPILDGGACAVGLESTVVAIDSERALRILRPGAVTAEALRRALGDDVGFSTAPSRESPGHSPKHYQPAIPLVLVASVRTIDDDLAREAAAELSLARADFVELELNPDPRLAARSLYADLRRLAGSGAALILVRMPADASDPGWEAIRDRLTRAASLVL